MPDSSQLCDCTVDPGPCVVAAMCPGVMLSQLYHRVTGGSFCKVFTLLAIFQGLAIICFSISENTTTNMWAKRFAAISCAHGKWSDISGLTGDLPMWMGTDQQPAEVQSGELFPCEPTFGDTKDVKGWYDFNSLIIVAFQALGAVFQLIAFIITMSFFLSIRSALRTKGRAGGNCCTDFWLLCCCGPCMLSMTARSSGLSGKSYAFTAVDGEVSLPSTKEVAMAIA